MIILYFIIIFFIIIFNILIPTIINRYKLEELIFTSDIGKSIKRISCHNNYWFYLEKSIMGLKLNYFLNDKNQILTCNEKIENDNNFKTCGLNGEYNNKYHPCYNLMLELLFFKNIKII